MVEQQALLADRGNPRLALCPGARVEKTNRRGQQLAVTDLAGVAGGVDFLANADSAQAVGAPVKVLQLCLHLGQTLDDRAELLA
ncbi:hypothetical protein D9M68_999200 [compost metagenome]